MSQGGHLLKAHRQRAGRSLVFPVERHQEGDLQKAKTEHQVETKLGRERIALIESALTVTTGLVQARVADRARNITTAPDGPRILHPPPPHTRRTPPPPRIPPPPA